MPCTEMVKGAFFGDGGACEGGTKGHRRHWEEKKEEGMAPDKAEILSEFLEWRRKRNAIEQEAWECRSIPAREGKLLDTHTLAEGHLFMK